MKRDILVAVYGTLKRGHGNYKRLLTEAEFLGEERINGWDMYHLGGFPAIVEGDGEITVETFKVNQEEFKRLDGLEGYPHFYDRKLIETSQGDAWIYFFRNKPNRGRLIENGVFER